MLVELTTVTLLAGVVPEIPNCTPASGAKSPPLMITEVPPQAGLLSGTNEVRLGGVPTEGRLHAREQYGIDR